MEPSYIIAIVVGAFLLLIAGLVTIYCCCCRADESEERRRRIQERLARVEEARSNMDSRSGLGYDDDDGNNVGAMGSGRSGLSWDGNAGPNDGPNGPIKSRLEYDYDRYNNNNNNYGYNNDGNNNNGNNNKYYRRSNYGGGVGAKTSSPLTTGAVESGFEVAKDPKDAADETENERNRRRKRREKRRQKENEARKVSSDAGHETGSYQPPPTGSKSMVLFSRPSTDTFLASPRPQTKSGMSDNLSQLRYKSPLIDKPVPSKIDWDIAPPPPARKKSSYRRPDGSKVQESQIPGSRREPSRREERRRRRKEQESGLKHGSNGSDGSNGIESKLKKDPNVKEYKVKTMIKEYKIKKDKTKSGFGGKM